MYASPAWASSLTGAQMHRLERVQKRALKISLGSNYTTYQQVLRTCNIPSLSTNYKQTLLTNVIIDTLPEVCESLRLRPRG